MSNKKYTVHKMIENYNVASDCMNDYVKDLIEQDKFVEDVVVHIYYNGKSMTYKECCNTLNQLTEENDYLRKKMDEKIENETDLGLKYNDITSLRILNDILNDQSKQIKALQKDKTKLVREVTDLKFAPKKEYSKKEIQNALLDLKDTYMPLYERMDFHDIVLIENLLLIFQNLLFDEKKNIEVKKHA